jgi:hypothetical protein
MHMQGPCASKLSEHLRNMETQTLQNVRSRGCPLLLNPMVIIALKASEREIGQDL